MKQKITKTITAEEISKSLPMKVWNAVHGPSAFCGKEVTFDQVKNDPEWTLTGTTNNGNALTIKNKKAEFGVLE